MSTVVAIFTNLGFVAMAALTVWIAPVKLPPRWGWYLVYTIVAGVAWVFWSAIATEPDPGIGGAMAGFIFWLIGSFIYVDRIKKTSGSDPSRENEGIALIDPAHAVIYRLVMNAVDFVTELNGGAMLNIPSDVAARLPKAGKARIIVLTEYPTDHEAWRAAAYEQFLRDDPPEDAIYAQIDAWSLTKRDQKWIDEAIASGPETPLTIKELDGIRDRVLRDKG